MHLVDASGAVSTSIEGVHPGAEWSPDGARLAYVSQSSGAGRIVVADADGSDAREVRQDDMPQGWHWPLVWVSSNEVAVHHRAPGASSYTLWIVPVDGGPRRLVVDPADLNYPLAMQPRGSLLVYSVTTSDGVVRALLDVRTGARRTLPFTAALVWSPDGGLLAAPRSNGIELVRPDGTGRKTIDTGIPSAFLAWSPDGSRIAFASWRAFPEYTGRGGTPTRYDVYSVAVDGSDLRRLTSVNGDDLFDGGASPSPRGGPTARALLQAAVDVSDPRDEQRRLVRGTVGRPVLVHVAGLASRCRTAGGRQECSSVIVRLRTPLAEVGHRAALPLTIRLRNDGTRTLRDVQLSLAATYGTLAVPGARAAAGRASPAGSATSNPAASSCSGPGPRSPARKDARHRLGVLCGRRRRRPERRHRRALQDVSCDLLGTWGGPARRHVARRVDLRAPGWDSIDGRGGNDRIEAGSGNDTVVGGTGRDRIDAGGGADTIRIRDGERDVVDCGTETDVVFADVKDVLRDCERVTAADAGGAHARRPVRLSLCGRRFEGSSVSRPSPRRSPARRRVGGDQASSCTPPLASSAHTARVERRCGRTTTSGERAPERAGRAELRGRAAAAAAALLRARPGKRLLTASGAYYLPSASRLGRAVRARSPCTWPTGAR